MIGSKIGEKAVDIYSWLGVVLWSLSFTAVWTSLAAFVAAENRTSLNEREAYLSATYSLLRGLLRCSIHEWYPCLG